MSILPSENYSLQMAPPKRGQLSWPLILKVGPYIMKQRSTVRFPRHPRSAHSFPFFFDKLRLKSVWACNHVAAMKSLIVLKDVEAKFLTEAVPGVRTPWRTVVSRLHVHPPPVSPCISRVAWRLMASLDISSCPLAFRASAGRREATLMRSGSSVARRPAGRPQLNSRLPSPCPPSARIAWHLPYRLAPHGLSYSLGISSCPLAFRGVAWPVLASAGMREATLLQAEAHGSTLPECRGASPRAGSRRRTQRPRSAEPADNMSTYMFNRKNESPHGCGVGVPDIQFCSGSKVWISRNNKC